MPTIYLSYSSPPPASCFFSRQRILAPVNPDPGNGEKEGRVDGRKGTQRDEKGECARASRVCKRGETTAEISRGHHSLPPRRLSVPPPPPRGTLVVQASARSRGRSDVETGIGLRFARFARSRFNRTRHEEKGGGGRGRKQASFFRSCPGPGPALLSREDRKRRGAEAEGRETPELSRRVISSFYMSSFTSEVRRAGRHA